MHRRKRTLDAAVAVVAGTQTLYQLTYGGGGGGGGGGGAKWHKFTKRGREQASVENAYEDFIAPYIRDMRSRGTYSERTLESLSTPECEMKTNHELIATLVHYIHTRKGEGAILIFVPGWDDISKVNKLLTEDNNYSLAGGNTQIFPLHSLMPTVRA